MRPFWQLLLLWWRTTVREPPAMVFAFVVPLVATAVLGLAFRTRAPEPIAVIVAEAPGAQALLSQLSGSDELKVTLASPETAAQQLRVGKAMLVITPGEEPEVLSDPGRPESRMAVLLVKERLQEAKTPGQSVVMRTREQTEPGGRYVDFLVPGLLGYGLMNSGIWGVCFAMTRLRAGKMLKRLSAASMQRSQFLLAFTIGRSLLAVLEIGWVLLFAHFLFDVPVLANIGTLVLFGILGALAFTGLSIGIASISSNQEVVFGVGNLLMFPMLVLSGVFFPASSFPDFLQPLVHALPLTALNDGLRALMLEGVGLQALGPQIAVLAVWTVAAYAIGTKMFRWV